MKKNEIFEMQITDITAEGSGVGRIDGMAVFVPETAVGDTIRVRILKVLKSYAFGKVEELLQPAAVRIPSDCPVSRSCGGCVYRHITYEEELRLKQNHVTDCLRRIGGLDLDAAEILSTGRINGYRNKAQYPLGMLDGKTVAGFYAAHSHRIVPCEDCPLSPPLFGKVVHAICAFLDTYHIPVYNEEAHTGVARHIYLRSAEKTGQLLVCLVINSERLAHANAFVECVRAAAPNVTSIQVSINRAQTNVVLGKRFQTLWGSDTIEDELCGVRLKLSPASFYQVNRDAAEMLYRKAAEMADLRPDDLLLDLYCGAGSIGLSMADRVKQVIGVEIVQSAVVNARENAERAGIHNAVFYCEDATQAAARLADEGLTPSVVIVDPPRKGCDEAVLQAIVKMAPERMVYISCNPATLARDCKRLEELGYHTKHAVAVDLFPRTGHVESVVCLSREKVDDYVRISVHTKDLKTSMN